MRIEFPRVVGYRSEMPTEHLTATFDGSSIMALSTQEVPTSVELDPIVGEMTIHDLKLDEQRLQTVVYTVAKRTLDNHFRDDEGAERPWLYPQLVAITRRWINECVTPYLKDHAYPQMLLLAEYSHPAADRIYQAIVAGHRGEKRLMPVLRPYEAIGSTDDVWFETTKPCFDSVRSHLNRTVLDSGWEMKLASVLEEMPGGRLLRQEPAPEPQDPLHVRRPGGQLRARLPDPPPRSSQRRRVGPPHARSGGQRPGPQGQAGRV